MERSGEANSGQNVVVLTFVTSLTGWGDSANSGGVVHDICVAISVRVEPGGMVEAGLCTLAVSVSERTRHARIQHDFACDKTKGEKWKCY